MKTLSPTMRAAYEHAKAHAGILLREPGGFWRAPGVSHPWFSTTTIKALVARGAAEYSDWKDHRHAAGSFPVAIVIRALPEPLNDASGGLKTIVYSDGSIESTVWADKHVTEGRARYATPEEIASYERGFEQADAEASP